MLVPSKIMDRQEWLRIKSWFTYKKNFETSSIQALITDTKNYYQEAHEFYQSSTNRYQNLLKEMGINWESIIAKINMNAFEQILKNVQEARLSKEQASGSNTIINRDLARQLLNQWEMFINFVSNGNYDQADNLLKTLKSYCLELNNLLQNNTNNNIDLSIFIQKSSGEKPENMQSVQKIVQGTLTRIQGAIFEQELIKQIQEHLPKKVVYNTGSITFSGKSIKPDLELILQQITLTNDKNSLQYIFRDGMIIEGETGEIIPSIQLEDEIMVQGLEQAGMGISVKSNKDSIKFHSGYNIFQLLQHAGFDPYIYTLCHLYQLGINNGPHAYYQKYAISKILTRIIGTNNLFIFSPHGMIPTYKYIEEIIGKDLYLYFKNSNISKKNQLDTDFGQTDIIGPSYKL